MDHPTTPTTATDRGVLTPGMYAGIATLCLVWGSTYLGISLAVETIPPFLMAAVRFLLAGLVLLGWSVARDPARIRALGRRELRDSAIVGALLLGGGMGLVAFGELSVPSGIAALLVAMMPLWVAVLGRVVFGERLARAASAGIALGLVGVAILVSPADSAMDRVEPFQVGALLLSPVFWSIGSLFAAHRARLPDRPLLATGLQMVLGGFVLLAMSVVAGEPGRFDPATVSVRSLVGFGYLTVIGSVLAFTVYGWLLRVAPLPKVATYAYVNPVVAVALGWLLHGEPIGAWTIVAGAVIVAAVALIITSRPAGHGSSEGGEDGWRAGAADERPRRGHPVRVRVEAELER